ncbi:hypothetical protein WMY93_021989 [Mugilogobius chulae]|uniref:Uncharacterized protein n=1 Tax=Mugilogobius chulae TaxID=88201 RepID=A0AAW0NNF5_9GOBI
MAQGRLRRLWFSGDQGPDNLYYQSNKAAKVDEEVDESPEEVEVLKRSIHRGEGLNPQQKELVEQMPQRLDYLERSYMLAKGEHKRLQRDGVDIGSFDPNRELESLIYQCGLQMDELKEQVEQKQVHRAPPTQQTTPPPPLQTPPSPNFSAGEILQRSSSVSSTCSPVRPPSGVAHRLYHHQQQQQQQQDHRVEDCEGTLAAETLHSLHHTQCPDVSVQSGAPHTTGKKNSAAEDTPQSTSSDPESRGGLDQPDQPKLFYSVKERPVPLEARRLSRVSSHIPYTRPSREADYGAGPHHLQDLPQQPPSTSTAFTTHTTHTQSCASSRRGSVVGRSPSSSLSSLRDAPHGTDHKPQSDRHRRSQEGLISPETDSGFMGSEESRLTPAAASSPVHQREPSGVVGSPSADPFPGPSRCRQTKEGQTRSSNPNPRSLRGEKIRLSRDHHTHRAAERQSHNSSSSEREQSDHSPGSSLSSHRHGDLLKVLNTGARRRHKSVHKCRRDRDRDTTRTSQTQTVSSKVSQTDLCFPQRVSRLTQTSADPCARPETVHRPHHSHSSDRREAADRDSPECPECVRRARSCDGGLKWNPSDCPAHCYHCHLCGAARTDSRAPPCVFVCPHAQLLSSLPPRAPLSPSRSSQDPPRLQQAHTEEKCEEDYEPSSLSESLNRALRAARSMKYTSRHMVQTLQTGLQHQRMLTLTLEQQGTIEDHGFWAEKLKENGSEVCGNQLTRHLHMVTSSDTSEDDHRQAVEKDIRIRTQQQSKTIPSMLLDKTPRHWGEKKKKKKKKKGGPLG